MIKSFDLGEAINVLGIRVSRDGDSIGLDQAAYIDNLLERFKLQDSKLCSVPMTPENIPPVPESPTVEANVPYRELMGCLQWLSVCTRPDITYAVKPAAASSESAHRVQVLAVYYKHRFGGPTRDNLQLKLAELKEAVDLADLDTQKLLAEFD